MPKTKTARPSDPRKLAKALVDFRIDNLTALEDFLDKSGMLGGLEERFEAIPRAIMAREWDSATEAQIKTLRASNSVVTVIEQSWSEAGFLVGLELGRRVGAR